MGLRGRKPGTNTPQQLCPQLPLLHLQQFNTFAAGYMPRGKRVEAFVIQNLQTERRLRALKKPAQLLVRMVAEGYTQSDVARQLGCSLRTVGHLSAHLKTEMRRGR